MYLTHSRNKTNPVYYINESFRNLNGKPSSRVVRRLGELTEIQKAADAEGMTADEWMKEQLRAAEEEHGIKRGTVTITLAEGQKYEDGTPRCFNVGYLLLQKELYSLGFKRLAADIASRHQLDRSFEQTAASLIYAQVLDPNETNDLDCLPLLGVKQYGKEEEQGAFEAIASESDAFKTWLGENTPDLFDVSLQLDGWADNATDGPSQGAEAKARSILRRAALLTFSLLLAKVNEKLPDERRLTPDRLLSALRELRVSTLAGFYTGAFTNTRDTQILQDFAGMALNREVITEGELKKFIRDSKKSA
jgi:hypothetical protein